MCRGVFGEKTAVVRTWTLCIVRSRCEPTGVSLWSSVRRGGFDWVVGSVPMVEVRVVVVVEWVLEVVLVLVQVW